MKYAIAILGILAVALGAAPAIAKSIPVQAAAASIEGTNLGAGTAATTQPNTNVKKKVVPPKKKPVKKKTTKKTPAKPKVKATEPAKKPIAAKKVKKPAKIETGSQLSTDNKVAQNADQVEKADLNGNQNADINSDIAGSNDASNSLTKSDPVKNDQAAEQIDAPKSKGIASKATAVAGVASVSGIGLILLLKKLFWH